MEANRDSARQSRGASHSEGRGSGTVWTVWRQDDNGGRFVVRGGLSEDEARRLAADLEARGHKQLYWVERAD